MKGLIYRDIISFFRRTSKISWFFDLVFILLFAFVIKGPGAVPTYLLLVQPINMSGAASTLKELDTNYSGRFALTLPVSHSQQVISRYVSSFLLMAVHLAECVAFLLLHYFYTGMYDLKVYLFYFAACILIGMVMTSVNTLTAFVMGLNASAIVYLITIVIALLAYLAYWLLDFDFLVILQLSNLQILALGTVLTAVIVAISYTISKKLYIKRLG